jgi:hypothetical protein
MTPNASEVTSSQRTQEMRPSRPLVRPYLLIFRAFAANTRNARDPSVVHDRRTYIPSSY